MNKLDRYDSLIQFYAGLNVIDWHRIKRQVLAESLDPKTGDLDPAIVSPSGAIGLMQFMPDVWLQWDDKDNIPALDDPRNPEENIAAGCRFMAFLLTCFSEIPDPDEKHKFALASYNGGRGYVNELLSLARESCNQPHSYAEWQRRGSPRGDWQSWDYCLKFWPLVQLIVEKEDMTVIKKPDWRQITGYVKKIMY